jgi:RimJ/RimL family protein N-acetyltransferase
VTVLIGSRLCLRPLGRGDASLYVRIYTDPLLMRDVGAPLARSAAQRSFERAWRSGHAPVTGASWWTIAVGEAEPGIGLAGLDHDGQTGELGVIVERRHQGAGVGGEALALLVDHAFAALALATVRIRHRSGNQPMAAIAARLGGRRDDQAVAADHWQWSVGASARCPSLAGPAST